MLISDSLVESAQPIDGDLLGNTRLKLASKLVSRVTSESYHKCTHMTAGPVVGNATRVDWREST